MNLFDLFVWGLLVGVNGWCVMFMIDVFFDFICLWCWIGMCYLVSVLCMFVMLYLEVKIKV